MNESSPIVADPIDDARRDADPPMQAGIAAPGWRLPSATRLGHVWLQVSELARSLAYYQQVLGLTVLDESSGAAVLGTNDGTPLVRLTERRGARPALQHGRLGLYHFAILLPDRPALGRFVAHLSHMGVRAGASDHLVSEAIYLRDPDGLGIEVYADRPRSSWSLVNQQIRMASEPLDLLDVVDAAGGELWAGMPAGTTMGHVHLHVGDIEAAAGFYHVALGFDKMVWSYPGALFLAAGGYHHHLGLNTWAGADAPLPTENDARLLEWRIVLPAKDDTDRTAVELTKAGYGVSKQGGEWLVTDPWDTTVRLVAEP